MMKNITNLNVKYCFSMSAEDSDVEVPLTQPSTSSHRKLTIQQSQELPFPLPIFTLEDDPPTVSNDLFEPADHTFEIMHKIDTETQLFSYYILKGTHAKNYYLSIPPNIDNNFVKFNIDKETACNLAKSYNIMKTITFLFTNAQYSFETDATDFIYCFKNLFSALARHVYPALGIIEYSQNKGWHAHVLIFLNKNYISPKHLQQQIQELHECFNDENLKLGDSEYAYTLIQHQIVKSNGGMLNYLKKAPKCVFGTDLRVIKMFNSFDRCFIFPKDSEPKIRPNPTEYNTKNTLTNFLLNRIQQGANDFKEVLQHPNAIYHLENPKLELTFHNALSFFLAKRTFKDAITEILLNYTRLPKNYMKCACPIYEALKYQEVEIDNFENQMISWLNCSAKRNSIVFIGPADTGKSMFAETIAKCFRFWRRLSQDGIFTFANIINQDVALWEEPFIAPDLADTSKQILEGNPNTTISIKNKASVKLHKKVPIIVATNNELYKYCSGEMNQFNARIYRYKFNKNMSHLTFCDDPLKLHECLALDTDIKNRANYSTSQDINQINSRRGEDVEDISEAITSPELEVKCGIHAIKEYHMLTFLVQLLIKHPNSIYAKIYPNTGDTYDCCYKCMNRKDFFN